MKFKKTDLYNFIKKTINEVYYGGRGQAIRIHLDGTETDASAVVKYYKGYKGDYDNPPEPPTVDILKIFIRGIGQVDIDKFLSIENNVRASLDVPPLTEKEFETLAAESLDQYLYNGSLDHD